MGGTYYYFYTTVKQQNKIVPAITKTCRGEKKSKITFPGFII